MILFATDLDQTLIYNQRSAEIDVAGLPCVEVLNGKPISHITPEAYRLWGDLGQVQLVPTTTRMLRLYRRLQLPVDPQYAIAANGGHLLVQGAPDPFWAARIAELQDQDQHNTYAAAAAMSRALGSVATSIRYADDLFVFATLDMPRIDEYMKAELQAWAHSAGWTFSLQRSKAYLVPGWLTKESAVAEVARRTSAQVVLAAGDSQLDVGMMDQAHRAIRPSHGELHHSGHHAPHMHVTSCSGAAAGEEILRWARSWADLSS